MDIKEFIDKWTIMYSDVPGFEDVQELMARDLNELIEYAREFDIKTEKL